MHEIKCPHCGEVFQVDETGYAQILSQVRDGEFNREIEKRLHELEQSKENDIKLARMEQDEKFSKKIGEKENLLAEKDLEILELKSKLENAETIKELAISQAIQEKTAEVTKLKSEIELQKKDSALNESNLAEKHADKIRNLEEKYAQEKKLLQEEIDRIKDFRARQSTKMVGENLEQYCLSEFNKIRMTAFPTAYFEKDNDARTGSKGDFIFKESKDDTEFISIMFEMKNEADETATKHKNEDFFKELDKDRKEKGCEYAVLVSMLENDSEYYNTGIVDVSYLYEKMYVVRPQFFIQIISILRNAALNTLSYKQELQVIKDQQIDIANFEDNMNTFKDGFAKNYELASRKFKDAIDDIDKTIKALEKTKADLLSSENNLRLANNKAQDLSIKKLTKNAPTVREMFEGGK